jgi:hypothetical protein
MLSFFIFNTYRMMRIEENYSPPHYLVPRDKNVIISEGVD